MSQGRAEFQPDRQGPPIALVSQIVCHEYLECRSIESDYVYAPDQRFGLHMYATTVNALAKGGPARDGIFSRRLMLTIELHTSQDNGCADEPVFLTLRKPSAPLNSCSGSGRISSVQTHIMPPSKEHHCLEFGQFSKAVSPNRLHLMCSSSHAFAHVALWVLLNSGLTSILFCTWLFSAAHRSCVAPPDVVLANCTKF